MTTFAEANALNANRPYWWVEIEGLPNKYSTVSGQDCNSGTWKRIAENKIVTSLIDWTDIRCSLTENAAKSPSGAYDALAISEDGSAASSHYVQVSDAAASATNEFSVYAKAANRTWVYLQCVSSGLNIYYASFNLSAGVVGICGQSIMGGGGTASSSIEDAGDGWYRCALRVSDDQVSSSVIYVAEGNNDYTFDGASQLSLYLWNPVLEDISDRESDLDYLAGVPTIGGQEADPVNGSCSVPQHQFSLHDVGGAITSLVAVSDTPWALTRLTAPISADETYIPVEDYSDFGTTGIIYIGRETIYYGAKATNTSAGNSASATIATGLTATAGSYTYLEDTAFPSVPDPQEDGRYVGCILTITDDSEAGNIGETRVVTGFSVIGGTGRYTWATPLPATASSNTEYSLSASPGEIKCSTLTQVDDYWNGAIVQITAGTNSGEVRFATDFTASSDILTLGELLPEPCDATTTFTITRYRLTTLTRGAYGSTAQAHTPIDENGVQVYKRISTKVPFIKTREVSIYEGRIGCAGTEAIRTRGWIDDYKLDASGRTYTFTCSGLIKIMARALLTNQPKTKVAELPLWGGRYNPSENINYSSSTGSTGGYFSESGAQWSYAFSLDSGEQNALTVNRMVVASTAGFADSGNLRVGDELIRYKELESVNIQGQPCAAFFFGGEQSLDMNELDSSEKVYNQQSAQTMSCVEARSLMSDLANLGDATPDFFSDIAYANAVSVGRLYHGMAPPDPITIGAFMEEHEVGSVVSTACVCADRPYSDFPVYDYIGIENLADGEFVPGDTITGGTSGATATVMKVEDDYLLVISRSGDFEDAEEITCGSVSADIVSRTYEYWKRNNAINAVLQLLMSTGTAGLNGTYDTLPGGFGLGLSDDYIDVDSFEEVRKNYCGSSTVDFAVVEETPAKKFLEDHVFRLLQVFPYENTAGKIALAALSTYEEARIQNSISALNEVGSNIISARMLPDWTSGGPPLAKIKIRYNKNPCKGKFASELNIIFAESEDWYSGTGRTEKIDMDAVYVPEALPATARNGSDNLPGQLRRFVSVIWDRLAVYPCPIISVVCDYSAVAFEIGENVLFTHEDLPNMRTSMRGLSDEFFQIVAKHPNPQAGTVDLTLWQIGVHDNKYARRCPSGRISAYADDGAGAGKGRITLYQRYYSATGEADVDFFAVGDKVMVLASDYDKLTSPPEVLEIEAIDTTNYYIDLSGNFTTDPSDGCILEFASFDSSTTGQQEGWCYLADETHTIGSGGDSAYKYK